MPRTCAHRTTRISVVRGRRRQRQISGDVTVENSNDGGVEREADGVDGQREGITRTVEMGVQVGAIGGS